ncbi:MAG: geranylgeranylglycerol-phosphate geranylgeranyltransferase [Bacteroidales bacterium]
MKEIFKKLNVVKHAKPFIQLIRPLNLLIIILTSLLTWKALIGGVYEYFHMSLFMSTQAISLLIASLVLIAAGGYVINDYFDVVIDEINKPKKQIIGKKISRRAAVIYYGILTALGIVAAFWAAINVGNYQIAMVHIIFALALWFYSEQFKYIKFWGNFIVSISTAFVIILIWMFEFFAMIRDNAFLPPKEQDLMMYLILGYAFFAFIATFVRELVKDRQDVPGDLRAGVKNLAVTMSDQGFKLLTAIGLVINLATLIVAQVFLYQMELILVSWYIIVLEVIVLYLIWALFKARNEKDFGIMSLYLKVYMIAGILSMQILYISW